MKIVASFLESIHALWQASVDRLLRVDVQREKTYPRPIVDHKSARLRALGARKHAKIAK